MKKDYIISAPFSSLSLLSCIFIIVLSTTSNYLRHNYPFRLIHFLSLIQAMIYLNRLFPAQFLNDQVFCTIQGIVEQIFTFTRALWIGYMSFEMYNVVIRNKEKLYFGYYKPLAIFVLLGILTSILPFLLKVEYKESGAWCWIKIENEDDINGLILEIFMFYGLFWVIVFFCGFAAFKVSRQLKKHLGQDGNKFMVRKIQLYPVAMIIMYLPITCCRLLDCKIDYLNYISSSILSLNGLANVIIFGCTDEVKERILRIFKTTNVDQSERSLNSSISFIRS